MVRVVSIHTMRTPCWEAKLTMVSKAEAWAWLRACRTPGIYHVERELSYREICRRASPTVIARFTVNPDLTLTQLS